MAIRTIDVFHPQNPDLNGGCTQFSGEFLSYNPSPDGSLVIRGWTTKSEKGSALFAKGQWAYVCERLSIDPI